MSCRFIADAAPLIPVYYKADYYNLAWVLTEIRNGCLLLKFVIQILNSMESIESIEI